MSKQLRGNVMSTLRELWKFMRARKKYWLMPIVKRELVSYLARLDSGKIRKFAHRKPARA